MKKLISSLVGFGAKLQESRKGTGFVVYNVQAITTNLTELMALASKCDWNIKHYPSKTSFDPVTGEQVTSSARYFIGPVLDDNSLSEDAAIAAAQKMVG